MVGFQELLESAGFAAWEAEAQTQRYTYVSRRLEALLGYGAEAWMAGPAFWRQHLHPEDRERVWTTARGRQDGSRTKRASRSRRT